MLSPILKLAAAFYLASLSFLALLSGCLYVYHLHITGELEAQYQGDSVTRTSPTELFGSWLGLFVTLLALYVACVVIAWLSTLAKRRVGKPRGRV